MLCQAGTIVTTCNSNILLEKIKEPSLVMNIIQSVFSVRKYLNIFLHHNCLIRDDYCQSSKKVQPGTIAVIWYRHFWAAKSEEPKHGVAIFGQLSMSERS